MTRTAVIALAAALACVCSVVVCAQEVTLRARVDAVTIDAFVHQNGRPIEGLTGADFLVRDNGVEQELRVLGTTDSAHVIMALDLSGSVAGGVRVRLEEAVRGLVGRLTPMDRVSLLTFADRVRVHDVAELPGEVRLEEVGDVPAFGATTLHDAVLVGSQLARADARPALLLVFTDGADTASWTTAGRVLEALRQTSVVVVTVAAGLPAAAPSPQDATYFRTPTWLAASPGDLVRLMDQLADATGGELVRVDRGAAFADVFGRILERYRQRYLLSFTPRADNPRGWHRLEVRLRKGAGTVIARPGYVVP